MIVVGFDVWREEFACLDGRTTDKGGVVGQVFGGPRTSEGDCDDGIPDEESVIESVTPNGLSID